MGTFKASAVCDLGGLGDETGKAVDIQVSAVPMIMYLLPFVVLAAMWGWSHNRNMGTLVLMLPVVAWILGALAWVESVDCGQNLLWMHTVGSAFVFALAFTALLPVRRALSSPWFGVLRLWLCVTIIGLAMILIRAADLTAIAEAMWYCILATLLVAGIAGAGAVCRHNPGRIKFFLLAVVFCIPAAILHAMVVGVAGLANSRGMEDQAILFLVAGLFAALVLAVVTMIGLLAFVPSLWKRMQRLFCMIATPAGRSATD